MKVRAQIGKVLNLDKCIVAILARLRKNVWTSHRGVEYAWFNNVETKLSVGYPKIGKIGISGTVDGKKNNGKIQPKQGGKWRTLVIFCKSKPAN